MEFDRRQRDQHHKMEMACHQAILNQGELALMREKGKILRLKMSLQHSKRHSSKKNTSLEFEEDSDLRCVFQLIIF